MHMHARLLCTSDYEPSLIIHEPPDYAPSLNIHESDYAPSLNIHQSEYSRV